MTSGGDWFHATFEADSGHLLLPGTTFTGATRYPFNSTSNPGMDVSGSGRGCNELTGSFAVEEAAYTDGRLDRIKLTFEQHCEGGTAALRGTLWWRSTDGTPLPPPDTTPPDRIGSVTAYPMIGSVVLTWADPTAADWSHTIVRAKPGTKPPSSATDGVLVYEGRDGGTIVDGLAPGTPYSFRIFPIDTSGNVGVGVPVRIGGSDLGLTASRRSITAGRQTRLGGTLEDATTGGGLAGQHVALYRRSAGSRAWHLVKVLTTGTGGRWGRTLAPTRTTDYKASFFGSADHLGATAGPIRVRVARAP